jgi:hypothetical protein
MMGLTSEQLEIVDSLLEIFKDARKRKNLDDERKIRLVEMVSGLQKVPPDQMRKQG